MRLIERNFSDREEFPSILIVNLHASPDVEKNLGVMEKIVETAHRNGANILIFPELAVTGYVWNDPEDPHDKDVRELLRQGDNHRIAPFIKRIHEGLCNDRKGLEYVFYNNVRIKDGSFLNSTFVLHPGIDYTDEEYIYDKKFLPGIENKFFSPGNDRRLTIRTKWGTFGFLICYDLCFVELARKYALEDRVDAIVTMAHWRSEAVREYPEMNVMTDHYYGFLWDIMNSSKAAYNQVWSLAANAVGPHPFSSSYFWGGSGIWAPSGMPLIQASNITAEMVLVRNLDIRGQGYQERDDFDYRIDFNRFYKKIDDAGSHPVVCDPEDN